MTVCVAGMLVYWDAYSCGPCTDDDFGAGWDSQNYPSQKSVDASVCPSGLADRTTYYPMSDSTGTVVVVTINSCDYYAYAEYQCVALTPAPTPACLADSTNYSVTGTVGPSAWMAAQFNDVSAIQHTSDPCLWIFTVPDGSHTIFIGVYIVDGFQTGSRSAGYVDGHIQLAPSSVSSAYDSANPAPYATDESAAGYHLASIYISEATPAPASTWRTYGPGWKPCNG
jgi:hypothetical protein